MNTSQKAIVGFFSVLSLLFMAGFAFAEYPESGKTMTVICLTAAGGGADTQIRAINLELAKHLKGVNFQVENVVGAGGKIAYEKAYKARPDGYTLLVYNLPAPIATEMVDKTARYKTSDFVPIHAFSVLPNLLLVHSETWKTLDEFLLEAQKRQVSIGTMGSSGANYLQTVAFIEAAKIKATLVPFGGGAESTQTLAGKHIDAVCTTTLSALPLARAGKIRPLIVFRDEPDFTFPGVLLSKDSKWDIPTFPLISTYVGPPNLSADKVKILEEAFRKALKEPTFLEWAKKMNLELAPMNAEKVKALTRKFYENLAKYESYFPK